MMSTPDRHFEQLLVHLKAQTAVLAVDLHGHLVAIQCPAHPKDLRPGASGQPPQPAVVGREHGPAVGWERFEQLGL